MYRLNEWKDEGRPGYLGAKRDETMRGWDEKYGKGKWTLGWSIDYDVFTDYLGACAIYEDAYERFLTSRPDLVRDLVRRASNVYDVEPSDVRSGLDYRAQQHGRTHIQDISIRRVLTRMGLWFQGSELIQIRFLVPRADRPTIDRLSPLLTPGRVPFHFPWMIDGPFTEVHDKWYDVGSVEAFYQFNKHLLVQI